MSKVKQFLGVGRCKEKEECKKVAKAVAGFVHDGVEDKRKGRRDVKVW